MLFFFLNASGSVIETKSLEDIAKVNQDLKTAVKSLIETIPGCVDCQIF